MEKSQIHSFDKTIASITAISACLWIGCTFVRYLISYDVFVPGTTTLRDIPQEILLNTIRLSTNLFTFCIAFYSVLVLGGTVLALRLRHLFKKNGFYFMASVLLFITVPFEVYLGILDKQLFTMFPDRFSILLQAPNTAIQLFIQRFTTQSIFGILSLLSIVTGITFLLWQPLSRKD